MKKSESQRSFCFDYKMLMNMYEINLSNVRRGGVKSKADSDDESLSEENDVTDDDSLDEDNYEDTD